ncbi:UvrD-helicase domain-containing protein [Streptomyces mobaraensis NBRC 13819 = DSM 40847]|uniref:DNA 3'-5' helicase n=1 Tax=Streptomyces mobaraensis (strain ATCC 29032 / DSM 40847 / JCM 4168 / NBRC 13819 / NCIMB 11159 / IPCR 16-22) TaxID=1223523 RepID=M3BS87_STRM1|nr:ATP-dependent DNA helicase [Streptomyces mobaraensis]EMF02560.1 ATP-dependent DNA helicase [Streptomyces mobaraensis NBRC 13819 = DSM 40847]QTT75599.1 UvrD-helicase domain-containing protein [Streptomyces mobaraensis NBRC 13819 = DSM 40847]
MTPRLTDPEQLKELLGIPFTPEQTACITAPPAPQVIVAGAGSGKTTVMAARVVWLVGTGQVAPERVLGLTFTNKAAGELAERVRKALAAAGVTAGEATEEEGPGEPRISTYHAFAGRLLKEHGLRIGLEPTARLLADATRYQLAARVLRTSPGPHPALTRPFGDLVADLLALDAELAEHLVEPEELLAHDEALLKDLDGARLTNADLRKVPETARARRELTGLVAAYRAEKRRRDLLDFGDQIALSAELARTRPEVGRILRDEFSVVLLDEYQDTSVAQRLLLAGLFGGGTGHAVTAVGDPCQAIYGWRGASVANLDEFPRHFPHADGRPAARHSLSENRRSGGRLLRLANGLAAPLRALHEGVEALRPAPGAERDGYVRCALLPTQAEELAWLADSIAHHVRTGTRPGDVAVLCRTAADFARIQAALVERDVPVEVVGLSGLLHLPEIADLVAVCEVLQDPTANASLVRLLTGPRWRIGPRDLALLGRRARTLVPYGSAGTDPERRLAEAVEGRDPAEVISLADALDTFLTGDAPDDGLPFSAEARIRFARLATELRDLRRGLADPLMDVLHRVLATTGLEVELSASPHALAARRRETLNRFLDIAAGFAGLDGDAGLLAFLGFLRTAVQYEKGLDSSLPGSEDTVKVLTAHKSKGLEWDVVAVPGLVAKTFPSEQARDAWTSQARVLPHTLRGDADTLPEVPAWDGKGIAAFKAAMRDHQATEELRLGYVTFTRPRSLLLASGHWWGPEQKRPRGPSAFLHALREHCEAGHGEIEAWADPPEEGATNPALDAAETDRAWPLPLDPGSLALRREAADAVRARLGRLPGLTPAPMAAHDPEWPPPPEEDGEAYPYADSAYEEEYGDAAAHGEEPERDAAAYEDLAHEDDAALADWDALPTTRPTATAPDGTRAAEQTGSPAPVAPQPQALTVVPPPRHERTPAAPREPSAPSAAPRVGLTPEESRLVASWDRDLDALAGELRRARASVHEVPLPASLTASQLVRLAADPDAFAAELARPMPRPPRPAARRGTRFHAWVESRFEALTLPFTVPDGLPGGVDDDERDETDDSGIADERDLAELKAAFERTPYAHRTPYRVEAPFRITLAGRVIRGRIDAVYRTGEEVDGTGAAYEIVDWKTGRDGTADPLQLAVYRLAWAERHGLPPSAVSAAFVHVRDGRVVRPTALPDRAGLERILLGGGAGEGE